MYWFSKPHCLPYSLDLRDMVAACGDDVQ